MHTPQEVFWGCFCWKSATKVSASVSCPLCSIQPVINFFSHTTVCFITKWRQNRATNREKWWCKRYLCWNISTLRPHCESFLAVDKRCWSMFTAIHLQQVVSTSCCPCCCSRWICKLLHLFYTSAVAPNLKALCHRNHTGPRQRALHSDDVYFLPSQENTQVHSWWCDCAKCAWSVHINPS